MPGFKSFKKGVKTVGILKSMGTLKVKNLLRKLDKERKDTVGHTLKKSEKKKMTTPQYSSVHQRIARVNSGNTITAKAYIDKLDKLDKEKSNGAKSRKKI